MIIFRKVYPHIEINIVLPIEIDLTFHLTDFKFYYNDVIKNKKLS